MIGLIWAQSNNGVIGSDGEIPWRLPEDLKHFKDSTLGHPVIMGRKTWESIGGALPGRTNIVISSSLDKIGFDNEQNSTSTNTASANDVTVVTSVDRAIATAERQEGFDKIWIIGGASVYEEALEKADLLRVTYINKGVDGDAYAPKIEESKWDVNVQEPGSGGWLVSKDGIEYRFVDYAKK